MARGSERTAPWIGFGLTVGIMVLGLAACAPVRSALRPYQATAIAHPAVRPASATPASRAGIISPRPTEPPHTVYVVGSQEQADALDATLAKVGQLAVYTTMSTIVIVPDHEPFVPQRPGYVLPVSFTVIDLRP